jgi:hypothetical protein
MAALVLLNLCMAGTVGVHKSPACRPVRFHLITCFSSHEPYVTEKVLNYVTSNNNFEPIPVALIVELNFESEETEKEPIRDVARNVLSWRSR